jgi:natural product biosynthesis luciferase-like monooxygenase protein
MGMPQLSIFFFSADSTSDEGGKYQVFLDTSRFADRHGFTAVWTPERHFQAFGGLYGSPSVTSAALAMVTKRIQIRAGSIVLPLQNSVRVAEEWSMIDNLSNGRVGVAFASGWHVNDFVLAPATYRRRYEDMYEKIAVIQRLWRGEEIELPNGIGTDVSVRILPRPIQRELPVWLTAASRSAETFRRAGELGFNILTANFTVGTVADLVRKIALYRDTIRRCHGRRGHVTLMAHTFVAKDQVMVHDIAETAMKRFLAANVKMQEAQDSGVNSDQRFVSLSPEAQERMIRMQTRTNVSGPLSFIGTVDRCAQQAARFIEYGVDEIACLIDFGIELSDVMASVRRLASLLTDE